MPLFLPAITDGFGRIVDTVGGTPTLTSVNANVTNQAVSGTDVRGVITFDVQTGTISAAGALFTVNFTNAFGSTPRIVLTNASNQTTGTWYVTSPGASTFIVRNAAAIAVLTGYAINYHVIG